MKRILVLLRDAPARQFKAEEGRDLEFEITADGALVIFNNARAGQCGTAKLAAFASGAWLSVGDS